MVVGTCEHLGKARDVCGHPDKVYYPDRVQRPLIQTNLEETPKGRTLRIGVYSPAPEFWHSLLKK